MATYEVIVVGSGAGGLSAALHVAQRGRSCLLLEAMPAFGGYLSPFHRAGYTFDTGLHYVGQLNEGQGFWRVLDELGIREAIEFVELDPDGFDRFVFPDYEFALPKGVERFRGRLIDEFPQEERGINRFFKVMRTVTRAMDDIGLLAGGPLKLLAFVLKHSAMLKYASIPYQKLLDEVTSDPRLQAVLAGQSATYGLPPARASAIIALMVLDYYLSGAYYPRGGSGALRDALVDALQAHGVEMRNRARVSWIDKRGDKFWVRTEQGGEYTARAVISNADPAITLGKLANPQIVPLGMRDKARVLRPSMAAFYVFAGTDLDLPAVGMTDANIQQYESYDLNQIYASLDAATLQERAPYCFITSPSVKDPRGNDARVDDPQGGHAPEGHHTVEIMTCASYEGFERWADLPPLKRGPEYEALKAKMGRTLIAAAERHIPGLSQHLEVVEYGTPLSNAYWVNAVRGGMYGPEETPDQMGQGRFYDFTSGVEGLYIAGAGTLGGGITACMDSGIGAAGKATDYLDTLNQ
jgi:phytoene dehydrogenase-like protein